MSATVPVLPVVLVARAAAAIANARGGRRGAPPITNVLEVLPSKLFNEVMDDARAALEAAGVPDLIETLKRAWEEGLEPEVPADSVVDCCWCGLTGEHTPECLMTVIPAAIAKAEQPS